ncbi:type II secretion system protein [Klebsiella aerogenes]|uniref:type II secretion system protein n=1 Tax=Klebsiella aerogenes TaxID=548 RepID=UPI0009D6C1D7|nr:type II secretion system protein [Klebsiella aerogenes]EKZ5855725.1 type II secretion system protein [Klebsiella aerogenes]EKZ6548486.1 type II secretion system protein [Klebsiella aerogenes]EKZ6676763.1 type II secretion system protein [Klebsiella aerogenes]
MSSNAQGHPDAGYTLIEILIVISLLALIASQVMLLPRYFKQSESSENMITQWLYEQKVAALLGGQAYRFCVYPHRLIGEYWQTGIWHPSGQYDLPESLTLHAWQNPEAEHSSETLCFYLSGFDIHPEGGIHILSGISSASVQW